VTGLVLLALSLHELVGGPRGWSRRGDGRWGLRPVTAVLGEVTPHALAIALSPFGVIVAILLLFTPRTRAAAGAFLAGWAVGIAVVAGVCVALASVVELSDEPPSWASWARLALGVVLLLVGV
jgi:Sap, sulfolipid-1-addressing protein